MTYLLKAQKKMAINAASPRKKLFIPKLFYDLYILGRNWEYQLWLRMQVKLRSLSPHSPSAVQPRYQEATDRYWSSEFPDLGYA